jgi:hypothetical protein
MSKMKNYRPKKNLFLFFDLKLHNVNFRRCGNDHLFIPDPSITSKNPKIRHFITITPIGHIIISISQKLFLLDKLWPVTSSCERMNAGPLRIMCWKLSFSSQLEERLFTSYSGVVGTDRLEML